MADKKPSVFINKIILELKEKIDISKISDEKLIKRAEKIREERMKERGAGTSTGKDIKKTKETDFEKAVQDLPDEEWSDHDILEELGKKRDLRKVFKVIVKNQPVMASKIRELLDWTDNKKQHSYDMINLLKEMDLVEEIEVLKIWAKNYAIKELGLKGKLTKEEKEILNRFDFWTKSVKEKRKNKYIGVSGYWKLTEKGKVCVSELGQKHK